MKTSFLILLLLALPVIAETLIEIGEDGPLGNRAVRETALRSPLHEIEDSINALYHRNGYLTAGAMAEIDSLPNGDVRVRIEVSSGPESVVERYDIGGFPFALPELEIAVGKPFIEAKLLKDMAKLAGSLEDRGFPFAAVNVETLAIGPAGTDEIPVRISLDVVPGDSVRIKQVIIPEDSKTKAHVVERLMLLDLPELYSETRINKGLERIRDTGWLNVSGQPQLLLDETGFWLLRVPVSEGRSVTINGILGFAPSPGSSGRLTGHLDAAFYNIAGTGRELTMIWDQVESEKMELGASYTEPWLLGGRGDVALSGNYYSRDSTYTRRSIAAEYSLPVSFSMKFIWGAAWRAVDPDSIGEYVHRIPTSREYSIEFGAEYGNLRPRINPRRGVFAKLALEGAYIQRTGQDFLFETLDRNEPIMRTRGDFKTAVEVFREQVLFVGIHGRSALSKGPLPLSDRYYLGGWGSLRGYREEQFSAEHIGWSNLEWRALLGPEAHGYIFFDSGIIRPSGEEEDLRFAYGAGLRLNTAIGRWDVSYGVSTEGALTAGYLHVGLSAGFE
ncbi:MAG: BamA/TamA family outer membrane protein [bacterium]